MAAYAQQRTQVDQRVADLAHAGKIRIGVFPSTQYSEDSKTGEPKGLAIDITRAIAARLGIAEVIPIKHTDPVAVVACVKAGECDLGFISIEPDRATEVDFTPPYIRRDFTYLVPAGSLIHNATDADRPGGPHCGSEQTRFDRGSGAHSQAGQTDIRGGSGFRFRPTTHWECRRIGIRPGVGVAIFRTTARFAGARG